ncbi:hypothetical protein FRC11_012309 [Ceratobasidium sp. 423]|nr:hypothetical protein FRC11_012309 [Ceratobasidium sp. 423]
MQNLVALDRNVQTAGSIGSSGLIPGSNRNGPPAQDFFHVSHRGDIQSFLQPCGEKTFKDLCIHIEQVEFEVEVFTFSELVVLASTISEWRPTYQLNNTNCYWFASLIWRCMLILFKDGLKKRTKYSNQQGRFKGIKIQGSHDNLDKVAKKCRANIRELVTRTKCRRVPGLQERHRYKPVLNDRMPDSSVAPSSGSHWTALSPSTYMPSPVAELPTPAPSSSSGNTVRLPSTRKLRSITRDPASVSNYTTSSAAGISVQLNAAVSAASGPPSAVDTKQATSVAGIGFTLKEMGATSPLPDFIGSQNVTPRTTGPPTSCHTPPRESISSEIAPKLTSRDKALRAQARLEGDKMTMVFAASQQAAKEGDSTYAKQLSELGWKYQERMRKLHAEAINLVSDEENKSQPVGEPVSSDSSQASEYELLGGTAFRVQAQVERGKMVMALMGSHLAYKEEDLARAEQLLDLSGVHQDRMHELYEEAANIFKDKTENEKPDKSSKDIIREYEVHQGKALRAQAWLEGDKMAMVFVASHEACRMGNQARAKQLSELGLQYQESMRKLHKDAAHLVFKENNLGRPPNEINLHGLNAQEAIPRLTKFLKETLAGGWTTAQIITEKGIGSENTSKIIHAAKEAPGCKVIRHYTDQNKAFVIVVELSSTR